MTDTDQSDITDSSGDEPVADRIVGERHDAREHGDDAEHTEHGWPDRKYIWLAVFLAAVTAAEIWAHSVDVLGPLFVPAMIIMMVVKFLAVVLFFMHLRFDSPIFGWLFWSGLGLAVGVYVAFLLTNQFFNP